MCLRSVDGIGRLDYVMGNAISKEPDQGRGRREQTLTRDEAGGECEMAKNSGRRWSAWIGWFGVARAKGGRGGGGGRRSEWRV